MIPSCEALAMLVAQCVFSLAQTFHAIKLSFVDIVGMMPKWGSERLRGLLSASSFSPQTISACVAFLAAVGAGGYLSHKWLAICWIVFPWTHTLRLTCND